MAREQIKEGAFVRLKSGSQGWIKAQIVEHYDVIPVVGGMMYGGGMTPGYKVHILEGKHKGETIRVPENFVEPIGQAKPGGEPLYPHVPKSRQPLFPHVPKGQQSAEKLPQTLPQTGACYADAWRFLIKEEEGELLHGTVQTIGKRINHAWVETETGHIWEPESGEFMKKVYFYERAKPKVEARYNAEEAAIMAARTKNFGPWTKEERAQYLGEAIGRSPQTKERLYQRGPDGYPVGADKIMRDAWDQCRALINRSGAERALSNQSRYMAGSGPPTTIVGEHTLGFQTEPKPGQARGSRPAAAWNFWPALKATP